MLTTPRVLPPANRRGRGPPWARGGWAQIFGGKVSETKTSGPVVKRNFYLPHLHFEPPLG